MAVRCSACHHEIGSGDGSGEPPHRCPNCGAEAGLEPGGTVPLAMKLFGLLVVLVIVGSITGGVMSRLAH